MLKNIVKIQYNSDFTLNCKLPTGYDNQDFIIHLYTTDKDNYYEASYLNGEYENCLTDSDNQNIVVYVNNHNLQPGCLHIGMQFDYDNTHFQDNVENIITAEETNVYLVKQNANATSAMYVGSALPDLTGSTDFITQSDLEFELLNYYTKEDIDNASYISSADLNDYVTEEELNDMGYLSQSQLEAMGYATTSYVETKTNQKQDRLISAVNIKTVNGYSLLGNGDLVIDGGGSAIDMSAYVTHTFLQNQAYVTQSALNSASYVTQSELNNMSYVTESEIAAMGYVTESQLQQAGYVTQSELNSASYATQSFVDDAVADAMAEIDVPTYTSDLTNDSGFITASDLNGYATETYVADYVAQNAPTPDLSAYVTKTELSNAGYITSIPSEYVTESEIAAMSYITQTELSGMGYLTAVPAEYVTESEIAAMGYVTESEIAGMGYVTQTNLSNAGYATETYVSDYVAQHAPTPDLSAYVSKDELNQMGYITTSDVSQMGYVTSSDLSQASYVTASALSNMGYITSIPSEYVTESELSAKGYITMDDVSACGYITSIPSEYVTETEIAGMGYLTSIPSEYITETEIAGMGYVTSTELSNAGYITSIPSEYITSTELSGMGYLTSIPSEYVTESEIAGMGYITSTELSGMGYLTSIPSEYVTQSELSGMGYLTAIPAEYITETELSGMGYVTATELSNASYATSTDLVSYLNVDNFNRTVPVQLRSVGLTTITTNVPNTIVPQSLTYSQFISLTNPWIGGGTMINYVNEVMPKIDENIIPKEDATYTLGDSSYLYAAAYISDIWTSAKNRFSNRGDNQLNLQLNNSWEYIFRSNGFLPANNNSLKLGQANNQWAATYSNNFIENGTNISDKYATKVELTENLIPNTTATYTLGDSTHLYSEIYINRLNASANGMWIRLAGNGVVFVGNSSFRPATNNTHSLGTSSLNWSDTYSYNFIENGTNIKDIYTQTEIVTQAEYDALTSEQKNSETIYVISDQQAYFDNELVTEQSLSAKGYLTAANFQYDSTTGTLTLVL